VAPDQPVYYVLLVGVIFGLTWVRAAMGRVPLGLRLMHQFPGSLRAPVLLFLFVVLGQALHSYVRFRSPLVPGVGLLVWLAPLLAIVLAYQFAIRCGMAGVRRLMGTYVFVALIALCGVYLEYAGFDWGTLGEVGEGIVIYDVGTALKAHSGFFRASEIAAWHTAAVACFVFMLATGRKTTLLRAAAGLLLVGLIVSLGILTGRRKILIELCVFACIYLFLVAWLQKGMARIAMTALVAAIASYIGIVGFVSPDLVQTSATKYVQMENAHRFEGYAARGQTVFADLPARVSEFGWEPLIRSVDEYGWFGVGLGTGSQGTSEVMQAHEINRGFAEGGLGKVTMELGIPGLLVLAWLVRACARHLRQRISPLAKLSPKHARLAFGLLAFLVANAAAFSVATQAYSDLFVLLILGWCIGFLFAVPVLAANEVARAMQLGTRRWSKSLRGWVAPTGPEYYPVPVTLAHPRH
jgi:hypothetical protein